MAMLDPTSPPSKSAERNPHLSAAAPKDGLSSKNEDKEPADVRPPRRRRASRIPAQIRRDLKAIGRKHRKSCAGDRDLPHRAARFYRSQLLAPRKRGAKPSPRVLKAV